MEVAARGSTPEAIRITHPGAPLYLRVVSDGWRSLQGYPDPGPS